METEPTKQSITHKTKPVQWERTARCTQCFTNNQQIFYLTNDQQIFYLTNNRQIFYIQQISRGNRLAFLSLKRTYNPPNPFIFLLSSPLFFPFVILKQIPVSRKADAEEQHRQYPSIDRIHRSAKEQQTNPSWLFWTSNTTANLKTVGNGKS